MTGDQLTLGALLARLEEREQQIAAQTEAAKERIAELSAQLEEFHQTAEEIRITRIRPCRLTRPAVAKRSTIKASNRSARSSGAIRSWNSQRTEWSKPGSSRARP
ncbi:hypothetical protein FNV62_43105 [Streptomyces sp. RLB3-17]|uniref:hypothetical protein n=1 Tax=unclassified Streptomyces TaxID=2593676 RepID=UPI001164EDD2|nr:MULTISPECIES: hypothetical protein [unclassified Streptomyces]NMI62376.1 hypothetical protein [Streptomyces sp. RLA2-12]QDN61381.1 hypothetical protein FNV67_44335 [Streptomyces sp. S1D4-20]QDN71434.1 hypothetical protein FNV66_43185 [Streptomyces sp. S1D4-14]QDO43975.1 hypothetical protein FNV62_43105 [Streptomyces sp. RLB3-17]QDO53890.1 hypothetical protein FNV60_41665 [Streptomyces sp. RLB3-5]